MKRNSQQSTTVDHYKMFKDGKHWVYAGITIAGLGSTLMLTTNALAATATPVSATTTSAANAPASVASQLSQAAGATVTESTTTCSMTTGEDSNTTSNTDSSATTDTNQITTSTNATETSATEQATSAASATDQASEVVNSASGTVTSQTTSATNSTAANTISGNEQAASSATSDATQVTDMVTATTKSTTDSAIDSTDDTSTNTNSTAAATPTSVATTSAASAATSDSGHGLIYETNDTTGNQKSTVTITQSGPYSVTWKKVTTSDKTDTTTVTLDASDIVAVVNTIKDLANQAATPSGQEQLAAAKAKLTTILDELKELPTDIASTIVGNVLYPIVFTGTGSEALSNLRTEMNQHRYDISNTWTGLDPVAYAADRAAAEEYYPTTVTWWDNVTKETWTLPEYNDPTQSVRAYLFKMVIPPRPSSSAKVGRNMLIGSATFQRFGMTWVITSSCRVNVASS